ncbi:MAG: hypothetical protein WAS73_14260, partial [Defluviicoccus sp.]
PGSEHGYDIIDHNAINPEVGDGESFAAFCGALSAHGMGQILEQGCGSSAAVATPPPQRGNPRGGGLFTRTARPS